MKRIIPRIVLAAWFSSVCIAPIGAETEVPSTAAKGAETIAPASNVPMASEFKKEIINSAIETLLFQEIPVTVASKKEENILKTVSTVSVIDQHLIERYNFQTIAEAVQSLADIDITRTTFMQGIPMARGIWQAHYANKVLVMINNVPSYSTLTGEGYINRVGINDVERIEVLKGPASVLYGSNAYVGAINIVLKAAKTNGTFTQAYGSFGEKKYFSAGGNTQYKQGDCSISVFANASEQEGFLAAFVDNKGVGGKFYDMRYPSGGNGSLMAQYQDHAFLFSAYKDQFSIMEGADPNFADGAGRTQQRNGYLFNYGFTHEWNDFDLNLSTTYDWNGRLYPRTLDDLTRTELDGYRVAGGIDTNLNFFNPLKLELGYNYDYRASSLAASYTFPGYLITDNMNLSDRHVYENSYVMQFKYELDNLNIVLGGRLTNNQLFGIDFSPRATIVYRLDQNNSLKLIGGKSYRVPSLFELYVRNTNRTLSGNTDLDPETAKSLELAYLLSYQKLFCQLQVFRALYEGFIGRTVLLSYTFPDEITPRTNVRFYTNGSMLNAWGSELEISYRDPALLSAFLTATYVTSDDPGNDINFKYIPDLILNLGLTKEVNSFFTSANAIYRSQTIGSMGQNLIGNAETNFTMGYKMAGGKITHMVSVKNAADVETLIPSVNNKNINAIPSGTRREICYTFKTSF